MGSSRDHIKKNSDYRKKTTRKVEDTNALIRHHLEEAATHLEAVKQLAPETVDTLSKVGKFLKLFYERYGGHPDA